MASPDEHGGAGVRPVHYDAELQRHDEVFRRACAIRPHERVLDVGCGAGKITRDAARAASAGSATGIDLSAPTIARARAAAEPVYLARSIELGAYADGAAYQLEFRYDYAREPDGWANDGMLLLDDVTIDPAP